VARRPSTLHDFIGQPRVVAHLRELVAGAKSRALPVTSILLVGPSGMGKSALARAIACEYAGPSDTKQPATLKSVMGGARMVKPLIETLMKLEHGDVLFIDETHALDREAQELLYLALDEKRTFEIGAKGAPDRTKTISISEFTLIGATTEPGKVHRALRSRLHRVVLERYSISELKCIVEKVAADLPLKITAQAARHLAERSQRTPRSVLKLMGLLATTTTGAVDQEAVRAFLAKQGVDGRGLDPLQHQLLHALASSATGIISLEVLAAKLGVDAAYVRTEIEPLLIELQLIELGTRGRALTEAGRAVAAETMAFLEEPADAADAGVHLWGPS
jgi:Holliday junction DNA helicase RuvB